MAVGADGKIFNQGRSGSSLGIGLSFFNDKAGEGNLITNQVNLCLSGKTILTSGQTLSAGIYGAIVQKCISANNLTWGNQYNGLNYDENLSSGESFSNLNYINGDFGTGIMWRYSKNANKRSSNDIYITEAGFAVFHVNSPHTGFYEADDKRYLRYVFHYSGAYEIKNTNMQITPLFIFGKQGPATLIYIGSFIKHYIQKSSKYTGYIKPRTIGLGGFLRGSDAIVIAAKYELERFTFGFSYDINISSLTIASSGRGGFEISLSYFVNKKTKGNSLL